MIYNGYGREGSNSRRLSRVARRKELVIPLNIYLPEPITILVGVLAFILGFL